MIIFTRDEGVYPSTLVICRSIAHAELVRDTFRLTAIYCVYGEALTGRRFKKLVAFIPVKTSSRVERVAYAKAVREYFSTMLEPNGEIVHI